VVGLVDSNHRLEVEDLGLVDMTVKVSLLAGFIHICLDGALFHLCRNHDLMVAEIKYLR